MYGVDRAALLERFANPRMRHRLAQVAADGSQKLPVRILPTVRAARARGVVPEAAAVVLAAWVAHLREHGAAVSDPDGVRLRALAGGPVDAAVPAVLGALDADLPADGELVAVVRDAVRRIRP